MLRDLQLLNFQLLESIINDKTLKLLTTSTDTQ